MKQRFLGLLAVCSFLFVFGACQKKETVTSDTSSTTVTSETTTSTTATSASDTSTTTAATGVSGGSGVTISADDQAFVTAVGQTNYMEVNGGKLALTKSSNADVKAFGDRMIVDHSKLNEELKQLAAGQHFTFPANEGEANKKMLDELAKKSGSAFDKAYINDMVTGHEGAVKDFEKESQSAQNAELKRWVVATLPIIKEHLKLAKEIQGKLK